MTPRDETLHGIMSPTSMSPDEIGHLKSKSQEPHKHYFSWDVYYKLVTDLKQKIQVKPDIVVSIGKGGSIPGVILAEHFNVNNLNFGIKSYDGYNQSKMLEYQSIPCYESLRGLKVLLVDDLADTGDTFTYALDKFKQNFVENVKTASVFKKTESKFVPNYYSQEISSKSWIVQPWEWMKS